MKSRKKETIEFNFAYFEFAIFFLDKISAQAFSEDEKDVEFFEERLENLWEEVALFCVEEPVCH